MKRLSVVAAVAALALASTPAFADDNKQGDQKAQGKAPVARTAFEINGTVKAVVDTGTVTVTVKTVSESKVNKTLAKAILTAGTINVKSDTNTVVKKGGKTVALGALVVGDKVNLRGLCAAGTPIVCVADRVTAAAAPAPKPAPLHLGLTVRGVALTNAGGVVSVLVISSDAGDDNSFKEGAIRGTTLNFLTDTNTVVTKAGANIGVAGLTVPAGVTVQATCTQASPAVCTAKRITVIVPTA